jgi:thymidylate synthase
MNKFEFIPIYCRDNVTIINPYGSVGVVTLWSRDEFIRQRLADIGVDLAPETSAIAALGNLYGNGLKFLLANLLYNPQIRFLLICGWNRSGSQEELQNFFYKGVETVESLGVTRHRILQTERTVDVCLSPDLFQFPPQLVAVGDLRNQESIENVKTVFNYLALWPNPDAQLNRVEVKLEEIKTKYFPSNPRNFSIVKETPLEAWKELIFCLHRFGYLTDLGQRKGKRKELQNVKVNIEKPREETSEDLKRYGFSLEQFQQYQESILHHGVREDEDYNYGNRIRAYFGVDGLEACVERLKRNRQDRRSFICLWDSRTDLTGAHDAPCLSSIFFRAFQDKLTLTASFRVHNAATAWLQNVYGLMKIQRLVSEKTGIPVGPIAVISQSISVSVMEYERILKTIDEKSKQLYFESDPHGQFRISVENGEIVVNHIYDGQTLNVYRSKKAERLQYELKRDHALSDIGHAIYIGRQLEKAESALLRGEAFSVD